MRRGIPRSEAIEQWRDDVQRRSDRLAVRTRRQAMNFIQKAGFCFLFRSASPEIPSLWHAVHGVRPEAADDAERDPERSTFLWELKASLPAGGEVYVGKLILQRPTVVSREFIPHFYAVSGRTGERDDYMRESLRGTLSPIARRIMDLFRRRPHLATARIRELLARSGSPSRAAVEQALGELQGKMYIGRGGDAHTPNLAGWSPVHILFPKEVRRSRQITPEHARSVILERHFRNLLVTTVADIRRTFRWSRQEIYQALGDLNRRGIIGNEQPADGNAGNSYIYFGERNATR
jgi:hypothetical protein